MIPDELSFALWVPISACLFGLFRPVRAVALAYLLGWLLLPANDVPIRGFWDVNKVISTNFGVVLGMLAFCPQQVRGYRFHFVDLIAVAYWFSGFAASIDNDIGLYDAVSRSSYLFLLYGAPFIVGRIFVRTAEDLTEVTRMLAIAAAIYALPAVWEWRMSPKIATLLYDIPFEHSWSQHRRLGFFRPILLFPHALGLGAFFAWTSMLAIWLYVARRLPTTVPVPFWLLTYGPLLLLIPVMQLESDLYLVVAVLCAVWIAIMSLWVGRFIDAGRRIRLRTYTFAAGPLLGLACSMSVGPYGLFVMGLGLLIIWRALHVRWVLLIPLVFVVFWMSARWSGAIGGLWLVDAVERTTQHSRTLAYRIEAEDIILEHSRQQPVFGWGTWGRNRLKDDKGNNLVAIDGLWLNVVSTTGLYGLTTFFLWWCWPVLMVSVLPGDIRDFPALQAVLVGVALCAVNFLFNGFLDPILNLMNGSAVTVLAALRRERELRAVPAAYDPLPATPSPLVGAAGAGGRFDWRTVT